MKTVPGITYVTVLTTALLASTVGALAASNHLKHRQDDGPSPVDVPCPEDDTYKCYPDGLCKVRSCTIGWKPPFNCGLVPVVPPGGGSYIFPSLKK